MKACAYGRPGSGRDGVPAALHLGLEIEGLFGSARDQALVLREQEMRPMNSPAKGRAGDRFTSHRAPTDIPCTRVPASPPSSIVCPHIFGRDRPARAEKPFGFNAAAARGTPKCAY